MLDAEGGRTTILALAALLDRIGPAAILVHSQSGAYGIGAAIAAPRSCEGCCLDQAEDLHADGRGLTTRAKRVPLLTMFGDFFGTDVGDWPGRMAECVDTVNRIKAARGTAENIHLPASGIHGNSHMLMMDTNNRQIADIILAWLGRAARAS